MTPGNTQEDHRFVRVQETPFGFVLHCACGWMSAADPSGEVVGTEWDRHRSESV